MTLTTHSGQRFPKLRKNQHVKNGTYFIIVFDDPEYGEQRFPESFIEALHYRGWSLTTNAAVYLRVDEAADAYNDRIKEQFGDQPAIVKLVHFAEPHIPYGDIREAFGMPREEQFAKIREVTITLTIPYAMNALPDRLREVLKKMVEQQIADYCRLGQEELHIYYRDGHTRLEPCARVYVRGYDDQYHQILAVVSERDEWQPFVDTIVGFINTARKKIICELEEVPE